MFKVSQSTIDASLPYTNEHAMSLSALLIVFGNVITIWTVAVVVPGMDLLMVLRTAMLHGRLAALKVTAGIASAVCVWGLAGFFGIHALFEASPILYTVLKISGGLYLCYIGLQLIRQGFTRNASLPSNEEDSTPPQHSFFRTGVLTNLANPKAPIFTSSLFAASIPTHTPLYVGLSCVALMVGITILWFSFITLLLSQQRVATQFQRFRHWVDRISGATLLILGGHFIFSRKV